MDAATRILEAADGLFGEVGFDRTSTREIAERAGVNKALIHYHYSSKDGLLESLLDRYYDSLEATISDSLDSPGDLRERFGALIDAYIGFLVENENFSRIVQREASGGRHTEQIQRRMAPLFEMATVAIGERYPASAGSSLAAPEVLTSFYGMVISGFAYSDVLGHLIDHDPLSAEMIERRRQHLHTMLDLTVDALERLDDERTDERQVEGEQTEDRRVEGRQAEEEKIEGGDPS